MKKALVLLLLAALGFCPAAAAAAYPEKAIQLVVPFPPGGGSDVSARVAIQYINKHLPNPLVVSNISGGTGSVGANHVLRAKADGYTLLWEHPTMAVQTATRVVTHSYKDFDIVAAPVTSTFIMVCSKNLPVKTAPELMAYMKANPKKVRWPMSFGAMSHFGFLYVDAGYEKGGIEPGIVANAGDKDRVVAIIGGHADASCVSASAAAPYIAAGDVLALGVLSEKRLASLPDVPTLKEQGVNSVYDQIFTVFAPKGTPEEAKNVLRAAMDKAMKDPEAVSALAKLYCAAANYNAEQTTKLWAAALKLNEGLVKRYSLVK